MGPSNNSTRGDSGHDASLDTGAEPRQLGNKDDASFQVIVLVSQPHNWSLRNYQVTVAYDLSCSKSAIEAYYAFRDRPADLAKTISPASSSEHPRQNGAKVP